MGLPYKLQPDPPANSSPTLAEETKLGSNGLMEIASGSGSESGSESRATK
jgi:hypothetical protein